MRDFQVHGENISKEIRELTIDVNAIENELPNIQADIDSLQSYVDDHDNRLNVLEPKVEQLITDVADLESSADDTATDITNITNEITNINDILAYKENMLVAGNGIELTRSPESTLISATAVQDIIWLDNQTVDLNTLNYENGYTYAKFGVKTAAGLANILHLPPLPAADWVLGGFFMEVIPTSIESATNYRQIQIMYSRWSYAGSTFNAIHSKNILRSINTSWLLQSVNGIQQITAGGTGTTDKYNAIVGSINSSSGLPFGIFDTSFTTSDRVNNFIGLASLDTKGGWFSMAEARYFLTQGQDGAPWTIQQGGTGGDTNSSACLGIFTDALNATNLLDNGGNLCVQGGGTSKGTGRISWTNLRTLLGTTPWAVTQGGTGYKRPYDAYMRGLGSNKSASVGTATHVVVAMNNVTAADGLAGDTAYMNVATFENSLWQTSTPYSKATRMFPTSLASSATATTTRVVGYTTGTNVSGYITQANMKTWLGIASLAALPQEGMSNSAGYFHELLVPSSQTFILPEGGTWLVFWCGVFTSDGSVDISAGPQVSIRAGGLSVMTAANSVRLLGFYWRIA